MHTKAAKQTPATPAPAQQQETVELTPEAKEAARRLEVLQEEALQYEIDIYMTDDPETPLNEEELSDLIEAAKFKASEEARKASEGSKAPPAPPAGQKAPKGGKGAKSAKAEPPAGDPRSRVGQPSKVLVDKLKLGEPTDADFALADKHGYPIAIPGAKAYLTKIDLHCVFGAGERPAGSVMLLIDAHAANKLPYLTPV